MTISCGVRRSVVLRGLKDCGIDLLFNLTYFAPVLVSLKVFWCVIMGSDDPRSVQFNIFCPCRCFFEGLLVCYHGK